MKVKTIAVETLVVELPEELRPDEHETAVLWYSACLAIGYIVIVLCEPTPAAWTIRGYLAEKGFSKQTIVRASETEARSLIEACFPEARKIGQLIEDLPQFRAAYMLERDDRPEELH